MQKWITLEKKVGETPLSCMESWRTKQQISTGIPFTYAGRLDPMASGKLLVLIGENCKEKERYTDLDKEYVFEILFGLQSDTHDVLGRLSPSDPVLFDERVIEEVLESLTGDIELPYPHFSSKTVEGKPLHTWAIEGRINEISIPTKTSHIYTLELIETRAETRTTVHTTATEKIETIPPVTELRKAIGNDFRRDDIRTDWQHFLAEGSEQDLFYIAKIRCIASSGTYMRSLAHIIGTRLGTSSLAYSIHRTKIGQYTKMPFIGGVWTRKY